MHRAARKGSIDALARLLQDGADIEERADIEHDQGEFLKGCTPLMIAARSVDGAGAATLRRLVEHGADWKARSKGGVSAAWYAAGSGGRWWPHDQCTTQDQELRLRFLLDLGSDPNECASNGRSLLTEACNVGDPARLSLLLDRGATVRNDPTASAFESPLHLAAASGNAECVRMLLDHGVEADVRDSDGSSPLMMAGTVDVLRLLIERGADPNVENGNGEDPLEHTLEEGSCCGGACDPDVPAIVRALIAGGAELDRRDGFSSTRLMSAAFGHHADSVALLLELGADPQALNDRGATALHSICWQGEVADDEMMAACERIIDLLVGAGIDPNQPDHDGHTPMHEAAHGDWACATAIRALLAHGADPDSLDRHGVTPLMLAAYHGEAPSVRTLLDAGADPLRQSDDGTPISRAEEHLETIEQPDVLDSMREMWQELRDSTRQFAGYTIDHESLWPDPEADHAESLRSAREVVAMLRAAADKGPGPAPS